MTAAAIAGVFCTYRHVPSRGVVQLVIEVPVEHQAAAFEALGYPEPGKSLHVAVARLSRAAASSNGRTSDFDSDNAGSNPAAASNQEEVMPAESEPIDTPPSSQTLGAGAEGSSATAAPVATSPVAPEGDENRGARAVKRAGILCKNAEFQRWMGVREVTIHRHSEYAEISAAAALRGRCQIASRRDLAHDERARKAFEALVTEYDLWRGRIAEIR